MKFLILVAVIIAFALVNATASTSPPQDLNLNYVDPLQDKMVGLWSTPILKRTLLSQEIAHNGQLNAEIKEIILKGFDKFKRSSEMWKGSKSSTEREGLNDLFFAHQQEFWSNREELWPPLQNSPIVKGLLGAIRELTTRYLENADPLGKRNYEKIKIKIFLWAGVHSGCLCHLQHVHTESAVSGTYYVSAPKGSGSLVLTDPRGLLPPFGGRHIHKPKPGEVILFPSWLRHEVAPSCGVTEENPRVALSFNVVGDWSQTNDATSLFFDLASSSSVESGERPEL
jgi:hypothetical protein